MSSCSFCLVVLELQKFRNVPRVKTTILPRYKSIAVLFIWHFCNWKCHKTLNRRINVILHRPATADLCWRPVLKYLKTYSETLKFFPLWYRVLRRGGVNIVEKCEVCCTYSEGRPLFSHNEMVYVFKMVVKLLFSVSAECSPFTVCCTVVICVTTLLLQLFVYLCDGISTGDGCYCCYRPPSRTQFGRTDATGGFFGARILPATCPFPLGAATYAFLTARIQGLTNDYECSTEIHEREAAWCALRFYLRIYLKVVANPPADIHIGDPTNMNNQQTAIFAAYSVTLSTVE
jgi:hypothetical protein